jgi:hypothetical protein
MKGELQPEPAPSELPHITCGMWKRSREEKYGSGVSELDFKSFPHCPLPPLFRDEMLLWRSLRLVMVSTIRGKATL